MSLLLIIAIAVGVVLICLIAYGVQRFRQFTNDASFALNALKTGLADQVAEIEHTPKSLNGMTSLCLPRITKDFSAFNWYEFRQKSENMLASAFLAITRNNLSDLLDASADLRNQISLILTSNLEQGFVEVFEDVKIHQTEIAAYHKQNGTCVITLQTAVGYRHYVEKSGELVEGSKDNTEQTRYSVELQYIQDVEQMADGETAIGVTCPNCGAPITTVGQKKCPYCGLAVTEISVNTWALNRYKEI